MQIISYVTLVVQWIDALLNCQIGTIIFFVFFIKLMTFYSKKKGAERLRGGSSQGQEGVMATPELTIFIVLCPYFQ